MQCRAGGLSFPALVTYCTFHAGYSAFQVELAVQVSRAVLLTSLRNFGWRTSGLSMSALVANDSTSASSLFSNSAVPQNNTAYYGLFVLLTQLETHKPLSWTRRICLREFQYTYIVFCKVDVFVVHTYFFQRSWTLSQYTCMTRNKNVDEGHLVEFKHIKIIKFNISTPNNSVKALPCIN